MGNLVMMKLWLQTKFNEILKDEKGEVNIVATVVLIGIAVLLAIVFKDAIKDLLDTLFETIGTNASGAISDAP